MRSIAIFGGTFDPIHNGHIQTSTAIQSHFHFDLYYFLPCKIPTIKPPAFANNEQRVAMIELALKKWKNFHMDLREIKRDSPSYMVDTLQSFRAENEGDSITLILGYDAFLSLPKWHEWTKIISLANLLVINRSQFANEPINEPLKTLLHLHHKIRSKSLLNSPFGIVAFFDAGDYAISSTKIRETLKDKKKIEVATLPEEVLAYIKQLGLYQ